MRAIICGGGTVGHVTPGIAIAEIITEQEPGSKILFVGREGGEENDVTVRKGFDLKTIKISGFKRRLSADNLKNLFTALTAYKDSQKIIKAFAPDIVIGTGGYVCWPVVKAAQRAKIPTVIHESNVFPGMTTKLLAKKCNKVFLNFPGSEKEFDKKENIVVVGNPLLGELINETKDSARKKLGISKTDFVILSFGGSGGAELLNENVIDLMENYSTKVPRVKHIHASGKKYFTEIKKTHLALTKGKNGCIIFPYINDMPLYMRSADIVISRCGAMTLSEIAKAGTVPILIPSPNVTDNHQYKNGKLFTDKGAALMIEESELNERTLLDAVRYLENNPSIRKRMQENIKAFSKDNSRELIYEEISKILKERKSVSK